MSAQLVYKTVQPARSRPRCTSLPAEAVGGVLALLAEPRMPRILIGVVAQYDEAEDDVPDGFVPVRIGHGHRGRVIAAPVHDIRPVL